MLPFTLNFQDGVPVSDQILRAVRKSILTGQLTAGDPFPSVRAMSQDLKISPTTAHKVVSQLKAAGYLASRPGIGMFVSNPSLPARSERLELLTPVCRALLDEALDLGLDLEDVIDTLRELHAHANPNIDGHEQ